MKIETKKNISDGDDAEIMSSVISLNVDGDWIQIAVSDILRNEINIENKSMSFLNEALSDPQFIFQQEPIKRFVSKEGFDLYPYLTKNMLFLFSFGEHQPSRYMLNLEGVWTMQ